MEVRVKWFTLQVYQPRCGQLVDITCQNHDRCHSSNTVSYNHSQSLKTTTAEMQILRCIENWLIQRLAT